MNHRHHFSFRDLWNLALPLSQMIYYHRCLPRQTSNCSIDHCSAQARLKITSKHTSTKPSDEKLRLANCCSENLSVLFHPGRSDRIHKSVCDGGISGFNYHLIRCSIADLSQYLLEFCFFKFTLNVRGWTCTIMTAPMASCYSTDRWWSNM